MIQKIFNRVFVDYDEDVASHKDSVDRIMRQGAIYLIPCHDCDFSYIGETKRSFSIRKKEHLADIRHLQFDK